MEDIAYFDNSATTKPCENAVKKMNDSLNNNWGNPSSLYDMGLSAEREMYAARSAVAKTLSCRPDEVYFTSGGTEANNLAVFGAYRAGARRGNRIVTTSIEHPSVQNAAAELEKQGAEVVRLSPGSDGRVKAEDILAAVDKNTVLVSIMLANNETGAIQPVEAAAAAVKKTGAPALIHADCVQAFGKMPIRLDRIGADLITVSGHKIHGPKGIGALIKKKTARILPRAFGGGQESGLRPGTEASPLIAGLLGAVEALPDIPAQLKKIGELKAYTAERLLATGVVKINSPEDGLPYILNISVPGIRSETMLHFLEERRIYVSSGSACAKGKPSYVLREMGLPDDLADSAVRISFSRYNTEEQADRLVSAVSEAAAVLKHK